MPVVYETVQKVVGDGTINSLDMAVLMYAHFGVAPYGGLWEQGRVQVDNSYPLSF